MSKKFIQKEINSITKVVDDNEMTIDHCISDGTEDRVGDDINQKGWIIKDYMLNPVVLDGHNYSKPPIGKCLKLYQQGNQTRAVTKFAPTDEGKKYFQLYKSGFMSAFSVGFIPKEFEPNKFGGYHMEKQELLEYSVVTVPCNPRAIKSYLKEIGGEDMKKEEIDALISKSVDESIKDLNKKHKEDLDKKDLEIKGLKEQIAGLEIKSGAKISKASAETLRGVCKGLRSHADTIEQFVGGSDDGDKPEDNTGDNSEKEYTDEEIQKMVADKVKKSIDDAIKAKEAK